MERSRAKIGFDKKIVLVALATIVLVFITTKDGVKSSSSCDLPQSPYFSDKESDLTKYKEYLEPGTCYRGSKPVDLDCYDKNTVTKTKTGKWRGNGPTHSAR